MFHFRLGNSSRIGATKYLDLCGCWKEKYGWHNRVDS
jgi:hypothetical protein